MCGIAGYLDCGDALLLAAMSERISHRGPDGEGFWTDASARVGLAHRRLAIIDLSDAAAQPMSSCEDRYQVIFNGEIYNYRELGRDLQRRGYVFNVGSDTAVLGPLWDAFGAAMIPMLNGIFAFAIWDRRERSLFVVRDGQGVKPLYYARVGRGMLFSSELKALLAYEALEKSIDELAIASYLTNLWSPGERTPFKSIRKLPPGQMLTARLGHFEVSDWRPAPRGPSQTGFSRNSAARQAQALLEVFDACVSDQCISDVPIGAFLSGGVDSSAVVASMVATGHRPRNTYCIGFDSPGFEQEGFGNDLPFARAFAASLGVGLKPIMIEEPSADDIEALVYTLDEPQADPAPLYVAAVSQAARADGIKVLMSGTGGDDLFSGYRRHRSAVLRARTGSIAVNAIKYVLPLAAKGVPGPLGRRLDKLAYMFAGDEEEFLLRAFEFNPRTQAIACLSPGCRAAIATTAEASSWLTRAMQRTRGEPLLERMLDLEMQGFLPDHNLNYTDKAAMAHGVEVRVPFLDQRLVAQARTIPWQLKTRGLSEKWLLKQAMAARLPASVLRRKKTGFGAPMRSWIVGPMRSMVEDLILSRSIRERGLFDVGAVRRLVDDTVAGRRDGAYLVLAVVMVEMWMRKFADGNRLGTEIARVDCAALPVHS